MPPVDPPGVPEGEVLHDARERDVGDLDGHMNVIRHQAEGVHLVPVPRDPLLKQEVEAITVLVLEEDVLSAVSTEDHVVDGTGIVDAGLPGHVLSLHHIGGTIPRKSPNAKSDPISFLTP